MPPVAEALRRLDAVEIAAASAGRIEGRIRETAMRFPEEQRSRQPSVFSVLRALIALFKSPEDEHLGFYGAFGYDLVFQFEPMRLRLPRPADQRDLVLYLPDEILIVDHMRQQASLYRYEFTVGRHDRPPDCRAKRRRRSTAPTWLQLPCRRRAIMLRVNSRRWSKRPRSRSSVAIYSRWCRVSSSAALAPTRRALCSSG